MRNSDVMINKALTILRGAFISAPVCLVNALVALIEPSSTHEATSIEAQTQVNLLTRCPLCVHMKETESEAA